MRRALVNAKHLGTYVNDCRIGGCLGIALVTWFRRMRLQQPAQCHCQLR
jgi:hypothetical protein